MTCAECARVCAPVLVYVRLRAHACTYAFKHNDHAEYVFISACIG